MKIILGFALLISTSAFAHETESCWGGPYWTLMDKSLRICHATIQQFENQNSVACKVDHHNSPSVCFTSCRDNAGVRVAKVRVDMTYNCDHGSVKYRKTKITWYR